LSPTTLFMWHYHCTDGTPQHCKTFFVLAIHGTTSLIRGKNSSSSLYSVCPQIRCNLSSVVFYSGPKINKSSKTMLMNDNHIAVCVVVAAEFYIYPFLVTHLQVRLLDIFSCLITQTTQTDAWICLFGHTAFSIGVKSSQNPNFWSLNVHFHAKCIKCWKFHMIEATHQSQTNFAQWSRRPNSLCQFPNKSQTNPW